MTDNSLHNIVGQREHNYTTPDPSNVLHRSGVFLYLDLCSLPQSGRSSF